MPYDMMRSTLGLHVDSEGIGCHVRFGQRRAQVVHQQEHVDVGVHGLAERQPAFVRKSIYVAIGLVGIPHKIQTFKPTMKRNQGGMGQGLWSENPR